MKQVWCQRKSRWSLFASWIILLALPALAADSEVKQRVKDVRELGKGGSASISQLVPFLQDPETAVRVEAVKALVQIGTQHSLDPLIQASKDKDPDVEIRAVDGLVNFYLPGYVKSGISAPIQRAGSAIKSKFNDSNNQVLEPYVQVRPDVIQALGAVVRNGAGVDARTSAARAVGILRGRQAVPDVLDALRSKDSRLIYECLIALQKIRDESAAPGVRFLIRDLDERVRLTAMETSGLLRDAGAANDLRDALDRSRSDKVKRTALTSLAEIADPSTRSVFKAYLNNNDENLRTAAAEGLGRVRDDGDGVVLEKAYNSEAKGAPRLADAFALVRYGSTDMTEFGALRYLVNQLTSASERDTAIAYLSDVAHDSNVRQALYPELQAAATTKAEKTGLAQALAASGGRDALPYLEKLSQDSDQDVAQAGLRAVRNLNATL
jgi:HEAT repeat protein